MLPKRTLSPLKNPTSLSFPFLRLRHQGERSKQRRPSLRPFPKLSLGLLQRPLLSHPPFHGDPSIAPSVAPSVAPSGTPSAFGPQFIVIPSHSGTSLLSLLRKKKVSFLDTSATSLEAPNTLAFIKNVNMVQLMLDTGLVGGPLSAYTRIQEFIAKVCIFPFVIFHVFFLLVCLLSSLLLFSHEVFIVGWGMSFSCEHLVYNSQGPRFALRGHSREFADAQHLHQCSCLEQAP